MTTGGCCSQATVEADTFDEVAIPESADGLPDCAELYRRWEAGGWSAGGIDLTEDRRQWDRMSEADRGARRNRFLTIYFGDCTALQVLPPLVSAYPKIGQQIYACTQISDEARHAEFLRRFHTEVLGFSDDVAQQFARGEGPQIRPAFGRLIREHILPTVQQVRADPRSQVALVAALTLVNIVAEGMVALSNQRAMMRGLRRLAIFPGFREGLALITRDEARHFLFGLTAIRDVLREQPSLRTVVAETVDAALPLLMTPESSVDPLGADERERRSHAKLVMRKSLMVIGVEPPAILS